MNAAHTCQEVILVNLTWDRRNSYFKHFLKLSKSFHFALDMGQSGKCVTCHTISNLKDKKSIGHLKLSHWWSNSGMVKAATASILENWTHFEDLPWQRHELALNLAEVFHYLTTLWLINWVDQMKLTIFITKKISFFGTHVQKKQLHWKYCCMQTLNCYGDIHQVRISFKFI